MSSPLPQHRILSKTEWAVFVFLAASVILSFAALRAEAGNDGLLHVYFLDVGQGDAEFIQAPNGNQILIDGGPDNKVIQELAKVMPFYDRSIDLVILTHPHADHLNGLLEVLKRYDVGKIIENNINYNSAEYAEWNKAKLQSGIVQAEKGQIIDLGDDIKLKIIYPKTSGSSGAQTVKNPHDYAIVSKLDYGQESVLFTADAEAKVENKLVNEGASLDSQFLKVGHHGSKTSSSAAFLRAVKPELAFIEVGVKNRYGLPHPSIIERLENSGIKYYRTDINGTIDLMLDGKNYIVK